MNGKTGPDDVESVVDQQQELPHLLKSQIFCAAPVAYQCDVPDGKGNPHRAWQHHVVEPKLIRVHFHKLYGQSYFAYTVVYNEEGCEEDYVTKICLWST